MATSSTDTTGAGASTTESAATTSTQPPADPDDVALAESVVLTLDDLPAGWASEPATGDDGGFEEAEMRAECPAVARAIDELREIQGRSTGKARASFVLGDQGLPSIQSSVVVAADAGIAGRGYAMYTGDDFLDCLMSLFLTGIEDDGTTVGEVRSEPLPIDPVGDESEAVRVTVPVSANTSEVIVFVDYVVIRVDRVIHMLILGSADLFPLPDGTASMAIAAAADFAA
ncbi:MAG: hypothetical protein M5T61_05380 [Acidimicrobiia bacterium]|nr:hypothetical protein [Acidimicrobiia bacterium]